MPHDPEILPQQLASALATSPSPTLVDVREDWEVRLAPFPASVIHIPLGELPSRAPSELSRDDDVVTICHHGVRSLHAVMILRSLGFTRARSLKGGTDLYSVTVDPSLRRY